MTCATSPTTERAEWKKLPFDEKKYRKEWGAPKLAGESGYTVLERVWGRPTFEVNGLLSGFTGEGPKTVLPAVAMAKVSMRLVPNQDPDKIAKLFEEYVRKDRAANRRAEADAPARRQAVDGRVRQSVHPSRRPGDRKGIRQDAGVHPRRGLDSRRRDVSGGARHSERAVRCRSARRERPRARTKSSISEISTAASSRRRISTRRSRKLRAELSDWSASLSMTRAASAVAVFAVCAMARAFAAPPAFVDITWMSISNMYYELGSLNIVTDGYITRLPQDAFFGGGGGFAQTRRPFTPDVAAVTRVMNALGRPSRVNLLLTGHSHWDHSFDTATWSKLTGARIIGSKTTCLQAQAEGVPAERCRASTAVRPFRWPKA